MNPAHDPTGELTHGYRSKYSIAVAPSPMLETMVLVVTAAPARDQPYHDDFQRSGAAAGQPDKAAPRNHPR